MGYILCGTPAGDEVDARAFPLAAWPSSRTSDTSTRGVDARAFPLASFGGYTHVRTAPSILSNVQSFLSTLTGAVWQ